MKRFVSVSYKLCKKEKKDKDHPIQESINHYKRTFVKIVHIKIDGHIIYV